MSKINICLTLEYGKFWSPSKKHLSNLQRKRQGFKQVIVEKALAKTYLFVYLVTELCSRCSFNVLICGGRCTIRTSLMIGTSQPAHSSQLNGKFKT